MTSTLVFFLYLRGPASLEARARFFLLVIVMLLRDCDVMVRTALRRRRSSGSAAGRPPPGSAAGAAALAALAALPPSVVRVVRSTCAVAQRRLGPISSATTSTVVRFSPSWVVPRALLEPAGHDRRGCPW